MRKSISSGLMGLTAVSAVGNIIISLPFRANDGSDVLGVVIAAALSLIMFWFSYPTVSRLFEEPKKRMKKSFRIFFSVLYVFFEAVLILTAVTTLCDFSKFTGDVVLPNVNIGFIFAALAVTAFLIGIKDLSALSKTATVFLAITVTLTLVIFLFSIPDMSLKYIVPRKTVEAESVIKTVFSVFTMSFAECFVLVSALGSKAEDKRSVTLGSALGGILILLCSLNTLLVFGGEFSATLDYPYIAAVKAVGTDDVFSGMEGFLYVTVFLSCIMKTALSFFGIKLLATKISKIKNFQ